MAASRKTGKNGGRLKLSGRADSAVSNAAVIPTRKTPLVSQNENVFKAQGQVGRRRKKTPVKGGNTTRKPRELSQNAPDTDGPDTAIVRSACPPIPKRKRKNLSPDCFKFRRRSMRLYEKHMIFPFEALPEELHFQIFSYLSPVEKSRCMKVCPQWNHCLKSPSLWSHVTLWAYQPNAEDPGSTKSVSNRRRAKLDKNALRNYAEYQNSIRRYLKFLEQFEPQIPIRTVTCSFDLGNEKDEWRPLLCDWLKRVNFRCLQSLNIDWVNTPHRPAQMDTYCCLMNRVRRKFARQITRPLSFQRLFNQISFISTQLTELVMPFCWSDVSVRYVCRLKAIRKLSLLKYASLHVIRQDQIDLILRHLADMTYLRIEPFIPIYTSDVMYEISHERIQTLKVVNSQGFFLQRVDLPKVKYLQVERMPWRGKLCHTVNKIPCLYDVIRTGMPLLVEYNRVVLRKSWSCSAFRDRRFENQLTETCSCPEHLKRSTR